MKPKSFLPSCFSSLSVVAPLLLSVACAGVDEADLSARMTGRTINAMTASTHDSDGGIARTKITGNVYFWPTPQDPGGQVFRLLIGENFHAVSGCSLSAFNAALGDPLNRPVEQREEVAKRNKNAGRDYPVRARFSCADEPGDLPLATTVFYLDDATGRYYFPTGSPGEYYSFLGRDQCVYSLRSSLFKLDDRMSFDSSNWRSGLPPDLKTEIAIGCDPTPPANIYRLFFDVDCSVPSAYECTYVVVEVQDGSLLTYLPVYRINGDNVTTDSLALLQAWLSIPTDAAIVNLTDARGFASTDPNVDPTDAARANIAVWKQHRRFWDLTFPSSTPLPQPYTRQHFLYGSPSPEPAATPSSYRQELLLNGSVIQRPVEDVDGGIASPFLNCEGVLETVFGLQRASGEPDSRTWAVTQSRNLQVKAPPEALFSCPPPTVRHGCSLALGGAAGPDVPQKVPLRTLNAAIFSAYDRCLLTKDADSLEITIQSDLDIPLTTTGYLTFGGFRTVTMRSASGTKVVRFHEQCDAANPCVRVTNRTRTIASISATDATRSLTVDHVDFQYVADNLLPATDGGSGPFFNLNAIFLRAEGKVAEHVRVVFTDSSIGTDLASPQFLSQAISASFADVFLVRTQLRGSKDANTPFKTFASANSLLVLDGRPASTANSVLGTTLLGESGGLRLSDGTNDLLAVNALVQGPIVANAVSQSTWVDSTLWRHTGVEAVHFTGTESSGFPSRYAMMWTGNSSRVTNLQTSLRTVPFALFDVGMKAVPQIMLMKLVRYFDVDVPATGASSLSVTTLGSTLFCNTSRGSVQLVNGLYERCPK